MLLSRLGKSDQNQNAGHIVRCAALLGDAQKALAAASLVHTVDNLKQNLLIVQHIAQAVGAEQKIIALFRILMVQVAQNDGFRADGSGDEVFARVAFGFSSPRSTIICTRE